MAALMFPADAIAFFSGLIASETVSTLVGVSKYPGFQALTGQSSTSEERHVLLAQSAPIP